ncbi:MAG: hypothetical protein QXM42_06320 [Zestosphaera sp.]
MRFERVVIVNEFSMAFSLDVKDVLPVLSDLQLHLSLWPIVESLVEVLSDNEVVANLKIGDSLSKTHFRISVSKEDEVNIVKIEGHDDLSLELRLSIVGRVMLGSPLTLVKGRISVKSANEKKLKPYIKEFVDAYQNRLIEVLPAVIEAWKKRLAEKVEEKVEVATQLPEKTVIEERVTREEPPKLKLEGLNIVENPVALEDEVLLSNIILKSQILKTVREELSGPELLRRLSEIYLETKLRTLYVLAVDSENNKVRILIRDGVITGLRIELREGVVVNGVEALKKLKEMDKRVLKITTYSMPEESVL